MTNDLPSELADLSPEQRELLALRLREARARKNRESGRIPLSFTQEQLWFLDRMDPGTPVYNVPLAMRLRGPLDPAALRSAINAVVARQEALRTVFAEDEHGPRQIIQSHVDVPVPVTDLRSAPEAERAAAAERVSAEHGRVSFDLSTGPLLAARLVVLRDEEHLLLVTVHHIVYDAWSGEIFMTELVEYYRQFATGQPAELPALTATFAHHARRQREPATGTAMDAHLAYWREKLAGAPATSTLCPDRPRPAVQTHRGGRHERTLPPGLASTMSRLARESGVTLNAVALAGFALALRRDTGQDDLLFGMPAASRPRVELEPLIGSFANMLVLRLDLSGDPAIRDLVRRAHRTVGEAYLHQEAPYAKVVEEVAPRRDPAINPLFQVMITVAEAGVEERSAGGVVFAPVPVDNQLTDFDLFVTVTRRGEDCELVLDYNADLYLAETMEHLADRLVAVFGEMTADAGMRIGSVAALRRDEIAVTATFTADLAIAPLRFWLDFRRVPAAVQRVPYGQMIQHLLSGSGAAATIGLLRWEDWLRHWDGSGTAGSVLDAAMRDLEAAVAGYRQRTDAPLILVRCPSSPGAREWASPFARLDDRLALLQARVPGVHVEWAEDRSGLEAHDPAADDLGHIPYTPEYFAVLSELVVRRLPLPEMGDERAAYVAEYLADPVAVSDRVRVRAASTIDNDAPWVEPGTPTEQRLAEIWSEALGVKEVGANADFFALGGHSLLATQVLSRVRREFGREVSLYSLFTNSTVAGFARILDRSDGPAVDRLRPAPAGAEPVASSIQQRLWATSQLDSADVRHNTMFAAALCGDLDERALRRAVETVVRRHEVLRTTFAEHRGRPVPVVHAEMTAWCEPIDISGLAADERAAAVREHIEAHGAFPYKLDRGPLVRVRLLRAAGDERYLLIGMHHIVCDSTSWGILLDEIATLYRAYVVGQPSPLPQPELQFGDFAYHQQRWLAGAEVESHVAYWREKLRGAPAPFELPGDGPEPSVSGEVAGREVRLLPAGIGRVVRELARAEGVTPYSVLLSAFAAVLYRESGQEDLVVGMPTSGRDRAELEGVIGCFADLLPLRLDLAGRPAFRRLVRRLHATVKDAQAHQRLPFPKIMEALKLPRDSSRHPLKCLLNYADQADETLDLPGIDIEPLPVEAAGADFDVLFTVDWEGERLRAELTYAADLFSRQRAAGLVDGFGELLAGLVTNPDEPIVAPEHALPPAQPATSAPALALASSFATGTVGMVLEFWSGLLGEPVPPVVAAPAGQVIRPLLDPDGPFGIDDADLNVVLLRWEDWLYGDDPDLPAAVAALELALFDLCEAVSGFRARGRADLVLAVCPASPAFDRRPWRGILAGLTERLRAFCGCQPGIRVITMDRWARRYGMTKAHAGGELPYTGKLETVLATVIARESMRRFHPPVAALVLDPHRFSATAELIRVVRAQLRYGREVILTEHPASPELAALVATGAVRLGSPPEAGVLLTPDRITHPTLTVITVPAGDGLESFAGHLWALDEPATDPVAAQGVEPDLLVDIATELSTAERIARAAESGFRRAARRSSSAPRTERERTMAAIWADVLHLPEVGIHDDFYDLGGDSLLAITVAFHAGEAGIALSARQLTEQRTIAGLRLDADREPAPRIGNEIVEGDVPLTPAQLWWYETVAPTMAKPAWFNHPYYLELRRPVTVEHLAEAVGLLAAHHDSLRLRFRRDHDGVLWQHHAAPEGAVPFTTHDLGDLAAAEQDRAMESLAAQAQLVLDLTDGPTCRVVHFRTEPHRPDRLLIVAHHLVVDAISRGVLLGDLQTLCGQLERGERPSLPAKTTAYSAWVQRLSTTDMTAELPYWLEQAPAENASLPPDNPAGVTTMGASAMISATLTAAETDGLHDVMRKLGVNVRDLIAWSVAEAVAARTGGRECAIATTGHGREDLFDDVDLSRTTGWFQVMYPVLVRLPEAGGTSASVAAVSAQLARVPNNGIGHGLLKFSSQDKEIRRQLEEIPEPRIAVNYMGNFGFDEVSQVEELFDVCSAPYGQTEDGSGIWPYDLDVGGTIVGGRLRLDVGYGTEVYRDETAATFLGDVRARLLSLLT